MELKSAADRIRVTPNVTFERVLQSIREPQNWLTYSGNLKGQRHSPLTQLTPSNVKDLQLAWLWQTETKNCSVATCGTIDAQFQATPGVWQIGSYDAALNLTYWGVGNPFPLYDGSTRMGDNLYSNSVVALDADTGNCGGITSSRRTTSWIGIRRTSRFLRTSPCEM